MGLFFKSSEDCLWQAQFIEPAVNGTLNVLASCAKAHTWRVVLTSTVAAINHTPKCTRDVVLDESFWSDEDYCRERKVCWIY
jgi:cinnamoyl-CoA reductase